MSKVDIPKLREEIVAGMRVSSEKLKTLKRKLGNPIVISENGAIKEIEAKDLK